jgi:hypothetical protein
MVELILSKDQGQIITDADTLNLIREDFSIANPAYRKNVPYISSRLYAFPPKGKFDVGLLGEIIKVLEKYNYSYKVSDDLKKMYTTGFANPEIKELGLTYRDYQRVQS